MAWWNIQGKLTHDVFKIKLDAATRNFIPNIDLSMYDQAMPIYPSVTLFSSACVVQIKLVHLQIIASIWTWLMGIHIVVSNIDLPLPFSRVNSLPRIWRSDFRKFQTRVPDFQMSCRDYMGGYQDNRLSNPYEQHSPIWNDYVHCGNEKFVEE